ncbi:hypothetical protein [Enterobacter asburiae]|uniref:hypothetical protein n=1 Tax=Enterobacter asburiae TaxID=61645 RepID=UPI0029534C0F|nr:hypothetical protein [Enterobacter asburiae]MDV7001819.1 hypothetical protein [Enterobacter asburiae]
MSNLIFAFMIWLVVFVGAFIVQSLMERKRVGMAKEGAAWVIFTSFFWPLMLVATVLALFFILLLWSYQKMSGAKDA